MKLVSYNIQYGRGKDGRFDLERIAEEVSGADVIALQEVERYWTRSGSVDQPSELARLLPGHYWVYGSGLDLDASTVDSNGRIVNRRRQFGNMLLSRTRIIQSRVHLLPKYASIGPALSLQRCAVEGLLRFGDRAVRIYSVHLTHLSAETRMPQVARLLELHRSASEEGTAITGSGLGAEWEQDGLPGPMPRDAILMGDFNCVPNSAEYTRFVGPQTPFGCRLTNPEGFVDSWVASGHEVDEGVTAVIDGRAVRLDYCFVSTALGGLIRECRIDTEARGSDHQPIWIELQF